MKNKTGKIAGFAVGVIGFLLLFKVIILDNVSPSDELAPGVVIILAIINGLLFAYIGHSLQNYFAGKGVSQ